VAPGLIYGLALTAATDNRASDALSVLFMLLSLIINIISVRFASEEFFEAGHYTALKLVTAGTVSAALFTAFYDILLLRRFSVFYSIAMPSIMGIVASLLCAFSMHLLVSGKYGEFVSGVFWIGMLSIFPLWQYLIGLNINFHNRFVPS
jgi:hypothetical protein